MEAMTGLWFIEMATGFRYVVDITSDDGVVIECSACLWVATTSVRVSQFLRDGPLPAAEIEDMGPGSRHQKAALVSSFRWNHALPSTQ